MSDETLFEGRRRAVLKAVGATTAISGTGLVAAEAVRGSARDGQVARVGDDRRVEATDQISKLVADDGDSEDWFGLSVAVSGDGTTAIVGAWNDEDPNGKGEDSYSGAGSAYVFEHAGGRWTQQAKLAADDGDNSDRFGSSVAIARDGTTVIVGAYQDEDPNGSNAGSAYVFEQSGGEWTQQAKLAAKDGDANDHFGISVAMSSDGTTVIVGAWNDEDPNGEGAGSAYVFERSSSDWARKAKLAANDGDNGDRFGRSVVMSGDGTTAIVGAYGDDPNGSNAGSAYVFEQSGGDWTQQAKLAVDDGNSYDFFGESVGVSSDGTTAIVGVPRDADPNGALAGSAYVFERAGGKWTQQTKLTADDGNSEDNFGASVAMSGDGTTAIVAAPNDENANGKSAGSTYVFERTGGDWTQQAKLAADDGDSGDRFGQSVAMSEDGTTAIVGAYRDEDPNGERAGSAYAIEAVDGEWPGIQDNATTTAQTSRTARSTTEIRTTTTQTSTSTQRTTTSTAPATTTTESDTPATDDSTTTTGMADNDPTTSTAAGGGRDEEADKGSDDGGSTPGFGVVSLLAGLSGTGYLLWRDRDDGSEE